MSGSCQKCCPGVGVAHKLSSMNPSGVDARLPICTHGAEGLVGIICMKRVSIQRAHEVHGATAHQKSLVIQSYCHFSLYWSVTLKYISYAIHATLIHTISARELVKRLQAPGAHDPTSPLVAFVSGHVCCFRHRPCVTH